jgi:hypothetical protein
MPTPTPQQVWQDPDFLSLDPGEQTKVMQKIDPDFSALPTGEQMKAVISLRQRRTAKPEQADPSKNLLPSDATIQAPNKRGIGGYLQDVEYDLRKGTTGTIPGRIAAAMGATGFDRGTTPETADKIVSPILGPLHAGQGITEIPKNPVTGTLKTLGGILQTVDYPLAFMGNAPGNAEKVLGKVIPSVAKEQAGAKFQEVMSAAHDVPVSIEKASKGAYELVGWQQKTSLGPTINKFLARVTNPNKPPLTYKEAREFYDLLGDLSVNEKTNMAPAVKRALNEMRVGLRADISDAAAKVGQAENLEQAMKQFRYGAQAGKVVKTGLKYGIGLAGGVSIADAIGRYALSKLGR